MGGRGIHTHVTRRTRTPAPQNMILALASINSSSRDLGASLPFSPSLYPLLQAPPVQDSTVLSHTLCWTYGPTAGTRINSCVTVLPLASTIWDEENATSLLVGSGPPGQDTDKGADCFSKGEKHHGGDYVSA